MSSASLLYKKKEEKKRRAREMQGFVVYSNETRRSRFAPEFQMHSDHLSHDP